MYVKSKSTLSESVTRSPIELLWTAKNSASRDIAILCFTFGGGATSDFQQLQVKVDDKADVIDFVVAGL